MSEFYTSSLIGVLFIIAAAIWASIDGWHPKNISRICTLIAAIWMVNGLVHLLT